MLIPKCRSNAGGSYRPHAALGIGVGIIGRRVRCNAPGAPIRLETRGGDLIEHRARLPALDEISIDKPYSADAATEDRLAGFSVAVDPAAAALFPITTCDRGLRALVELICI